MVDFKEYAVKWTDHDNDWYFVASKVKTLSDNFDAITDYMHFLAYLALLYSVIIISIFSLK